MTTALALIALVSVSSAQNQLAELSEVWKRTAAPHFAEISNPVVFDVDLVAVPPTHQRKGGQGERLGRLAVVMQREWRQVKGVQVFARTGLQGSDTAVRDSDLGAQWLAALDPGLAGRMGGDGVRFHELDDKGQRFLSRLVSQMVPGMADQLLGEPQNVEVTLSLNAMLHFQSRTSGREVAIPAFTGSGSPGGQQRPEPQPRAAPARVDIPLDVAEDGPLDFGEGAVLPLATIIYKAEQAFGKKYVSDPRTATSTIYIRGKFSKAAFDEAIREVAAVPPPIPALDAERARELMKQAIEGALSKLLEDQVGKEARDLLKKGEISVSDLVKLWPEMAKQLSPYGLQPGDRLRMSVGVQVEVNGRGTSKLPGSSAMINGQPTGGVSTRNNVRFIISP